MPNKKTTLLLIALLCGLGLRAQQPMSLDDCRRRALQANRGLKQAELKQQETAALEKVALFQMMPKVSATGGYLWMEKSVNLISDEQRERINHLGDNVQEGIANALHEELGDLPLVGERLADRLSDVVANSEMTSSLNEVGQNITQGLETDTRNMGLATVTLTQPIYLGGKLIAMHRTARLANRLAGIELDQKQQQTLVAVDEAYWQVVSVQHKQRLAERYAALLDTLEHNVGLLVEAEMATRGDLAKVRVKRNEAHMSLTKANNGLMLSRMLLAERCGMPLDTLFEVEGGDWMAAHTAAQPAPVSYRLDEVYALRPETRMLRIGDSIAREGVRIAASTLKPNIVATGGYLVSNPNVFDGFSNTWGGTWMAGVVVAVPLVHPAGVFAVKAAKAKRAEAAYKREEAEELIALQVKKLACELELAYSHLAQAESDLDAAEENLRLADESFKAGMCSSSDLMAAQTAWMQAEGEVIDTRIEIEMGKVYLDQALGKRPL